MVNGVLWSIFSMSLSVISGLFLLVFNGGMGDVYDLCSFVFLFPCCLVFFFPY